MFRKVKSQSQLKKNKFVHKKNLVRKMLLDYTYSRVPKQITLNRYQVTKNNVFINFERWIQRNSWEPPEGLK